ncbi:MAG: MFS transporter [Lachnospiraceae bacterium]|nr:MFS transporter [Lachnospiraceae bacterium]
MEKLRKITDDRTARVLFLLCWSAYFTSYIGRLNYSSAMTAMIQEQILTKSQAGFISMVYFFAYGIGQLCNGLLGDRIHPGRMIFTGLSLAAVMNLLMGFTGNFFLMSVIWGINGYAQAMIWPPIIRIFAEMLEKEKKMRYCVDIVSSQVVGTLASYLIAAAVMWLFGWKAVFAAAALCLAVMAAAWMAGFKRVEKGGGKAHVEAQAPASSAQTQTAVPSTDSRSASAGNTAPDHSFSHLLLHCGLLAVLFPVVIHGMLKDGVTTWVPTYITETFMTSPSFSILVTTVLPVINLTGAYAARTVYKKCREHEVKAAALFFTVATAALCGLWVGRGVSILLTVLLFALTTASMMAVNTLFVNMLPLRFERLGRVSTVSGFLNSAAYLGTAVSTFTIGIMVERMGWDVTIGSWVLLTGGALVVCILFRKREIG